MMLARTERTVLIAMELFIGVMAIVGTVGLLGGFWSQVLPAEMLRGSPFTSYLIPALALLVLVGGSSFLAALFLLGDRSVGVVVSLLAGVILVSFEVVEYLVIGMTMFLRPLMFVLGLFLIALAAHRQAAEYADGPGARPTGRAPGPSAYHSYVLGHVRRDVRPNDLDRALGDQRGDRREGGDLRHQKGPDHPHRQGKLDDRVPVVLDDDLTDVTCRNQLVDLLHELASPDPDLLRDDGRAI
jgi:hypothetical protein